MVNKIKVFALVALLFVVFSQGQTGPPTSISPTLVASPLASTVTTTSVSTISVIASTLSSPTSTAAVPQTQTSPLTASSPLSMTLSTSSTAGTSSSALVTLSATNVSPNPTPGMYGYGSSLRVLNFDNFTGINYTWGTPFVDEAICHGGISPNQWARVASLELLPKPYETLSNGNFLLFPIFGWAQFGHFYAVIMACDNPFGLLNLTAGCSAYQGENNTCLLRFICYTAADWSTSVEADCNATTSLSGSGTGTPPGITPTPFTNCTFPSTFNGCYAVSLEMISPPDETAFMNWIGIDDVTVVLNGDSGHSGPFPSAAWTQPAWNASLTISMTPIAATGISTSSGTPPAISPAVSPTTDALIGGTPTLATVPTTFSSSSTSTTVGTSTSSLSGVA